MTLSTLFELFLDDYLPERADSAHQTYRSHAKMLLADLGDLELSSITPQDIIAWVKSAKRSLRMTSVVHRLSFFRQAFAWAKFCGHVSESPIEEVKSPKEKQKMRRRFLKPEEEQRLQDLASAETFSLIRFAILTGLRRLEIFRLTEQHIDWDNKIVHVAESKTDEERFVPLHPEAMLICAFWKAQGGAYLFAPELNPKRRWQAAKHWCCTRYVPLVQKAEITDLRFHDLRHTFASRLVQEGVPLYHVQMLLGHKSPAMTQRYAHLEAEHLRKAIYRLN